jgi:hypothetical protein
MDTPLEIELADSRCLVQVHIDADPEIHRPYAAAP